ERTAPAAEPVDASAEEGVMEETEIVGDRLPGSAATGGEQHRDHRERDRERPSVPPQALRTRFNLKCGSRLRLANRRLRWANHGQSLFAIAARSKCGEELRRSEGLRFRCGTDYAC